MRILKSLSEPKTLAELVDEVGLTRQTLSKYLKALEAKGLVSRSYEKPGRGRPKSLFLAVKKGEKAVKASTQKPLERRDLIHVRFGAFRKICRLNQDGICTKTRRACRLRNCPLATQK